MFARETIERAVCTAEIIDGHLRRIRIDERDRCFAFSFARLSIFVDPDLRFGRADIDLYNVFGEHRVDEEETMSTGAMGPHEAPKTSANVSFWISLGKPVT